MRLEIKSRLSGLYSHLSNRTFSIYWQERQRHVLSSLEIQPSDVVLEIGCGAGLWTSYIAPRISFMAALDLTGPSLRHARGWRSPREPLHPTELAKFVQASAVQIPFRPETFDKILMIDVIEHVPDHSQALREIARVLKANGKLVLTTLQDDRSSYVRPLNFSEHIREYDAAGLDQLLADAGFRGKSFVFYYASATIARELQTWFQSTRFGRILGLEILFGIPLRLMSHIDRVIPLGRPGGIGVVAIKSPL